MRFNFLMGAILASFALTSCSWVRDSVKPQKSFESKQMDLSCLRVMPTQLQNLFAGKYQDNFKDKQSIQDIWSCLDQSLNTFSKYTRGANEGFYRNSELQSFANRYLPSDQLFSKSLIDAIFRLKTDVLGGTPDRITHEEIIKLRGKLNRFGEIILPLAPYISTLLKPFETLSDGRAQIAGQRLNQFVLDIADLLGDSENTVSWTEISTFVGELEKYLGSPNPTALTVIREQIQVFQYMKLMIVGGDENGIERSKWHPILKTISMIYNALYLTASTNEMMEQLGLEIQANDEEQKKATEMLTLVLKKLKRDQKVYTKSTISLLSDRWAKTLILNSFLYPDSPDKLAIKRYFGSPAMRRLTGFLIDDLTKIMNGDRSDDVVDRMANNLIELFEKARDKNTAVINLARMRDYLGSLKILFEQESDFQSIDLIFAMMDDVTSILIGKESGSMTARDFRVLIRKSSELYSIWGGEKSGDFNQSLSQSLEILLRRPSTNMISVQRVRSILRNTEKLFSNMQFNSTVDWAALDEMVLDGARLKSVLFGTTTESILYSELMQIHSAWKAFNEKPDLSDALENLAKFFKNNPFSSVKLKELMFAIDRFLPENRKLEKLGLTEDLIGPLKVFLIGGSPNRLDRTEYSKLAQLGFTIFRNLKPVTQTLPENYSAGLNSHTMAILEAVVQGMMDNEDFTYSNPALKELLASQLKGPGMKVQSKTLDLLLIALNHRVLDKNKGPKPSTYPASIASWKLTSMRDLLKLMKLDLQDLEAAYLGTAEKTPISGPALYSKLRRNDTRFILSSLHPILNEKTGMPYFPGFNTANTDYYLEDLRYKSVIYQGLMWILPAYEVEADPTKPNSLPRLTINDLYDLFDDINDAVYELGLSFSPDPVKKSADRRMQSINLFTRTGNGDAFIDVIETVDFLTTTFAGKNLFDEVRQDLVSKCYSSNLSYRTQNEFSVSCIENTFFESRTFFEHYNKVIPTMTSYFLKLSGKDRSQFINSVMVAATTPDWRKKGEINLNDLETLVSTPYYAENIFLRLDRDHDGILLFSEGMNGFPIFCREIKKAVGESVSGSCEDGEKPKQIEAIYGHLLIKRRPPRSIKPDDSWYEKLIIGKEFLVWVTKWKFRSDDWTEYDATEPKSERKDLLDIMANLSVTITPVDPSAKPESVAAWSSKRLYGEQFAR
jgi:hypothetical protein